MKSVKNIPVFVPSMPTEKDIRKFLKRIDSARIYSNFGPLLDELEEKFCRYFEIPRENLVLLSNATVSLEGAIQTSQVSSWVCPSWSFAATGQALCRSHTNFRFIDIDEDGRISENSLGRLSGTYDAVVDVLPFGDTFSLRRYSTLPKVMLIDAAASFDALGGIGRALLSEYEKNRIGVIVSLHATKLVSTGEGGIFFSNDPQWVKSVRNWSRFGFANGDRISYQSGTNAKLSEYSAAVGLASIDNWSQLRRRYLEISTWAIDVSKRYGFQVHGGMRNGYATPYWVVRGDEARIESIRKLSQELGIGTRKWWEDGMHRMPFLSIVPYGDLATTEKIARETLGLPFHLQLTIENRNRIEIMFSRA